MDFTSVVEEMHAQRIPVRRFEREGHSRFRDTITLSSNGQACFERFCYGEAAGLVCTLRGNFELSGNAIIWKYEDCPYSGKGEAPKELTGFEGDALLFDSGKAKWLPRENLKAMPGEGLFSRLKKKFR